MSKNSFIIKITYVIVSFLLPCLSFTQNTSPLGCTDNTGDPIVKQDFGSGPNFGPALGSGQTTLSYVADMCPKDGNYTIASYTSGCYSSWHTLTDHTGNTNGYFMLINASYDPSVFYVQQVNGLCEASTYLFSAWIINMIPTGGILPNITMTIEEINGTVLATYNTGDIAGNTAVVWQQYKMFFTTAPGITSVVLRMKNNAPGGGGNDLALDDITFSPAGPNVTTIASQNGKDTISVCRNSTPVKLKGAAASCYTNAAYQWQESKDSGNTWNDISGANTDIFFSPTADTGFFYYRLSVAEAVNITNTQCRVVSNKISVYVYPDTSFVSIATAKTTICEGETLNFDISPTNGGSNPQYDWYINNIKTASGASFSSASFVDGDIVKCIMQSSIPCGLSPATSNEIIIRVNKKSSSVIDKIICEGNSCEGYTTSGIYTDNFTNANGCDSTRTLNLTVLPKSSTFIDTTICEGQNYMGYTTDGIYTNTYTSTNGCDSVHTIALHVNPLPRPTLGADTAICSGDLFTISPGSFDTYLWQDGSTLSSFTVNTGGIYTVTVTNQCGEKTTAVRVKDTVCDIRFPSAFTPNGDGKNDCFRVLNGFKITDYHLEIYNRWGQKVFETDNPSDCWNGNVAGTGANKNINGTNTYVWLCRINNLQTILKGTVTVIK